jgi:hypothetical protein
MQLRVKSFQQRGSVDFSRAYKIDSSGVTIPKALTAFSFRYSLAWSFKTASWLFKTLSGRELC